MLTARLALQLQSRGHSVEVWTSRAEGDALAAHEDDRRRHRTSLRLRAAPRAQARALPPFFLDAAANARLLGSAARAFNPDVLHVQCFSGNGAYATGLSYLTGTPLLLTLQGETVMDDQDIYDRSATLRAALRLGLRRAVLVTGCSAFALDDARIRFGLDMRKARVIFNGVDLDQSGRLHPISLPVRPLRAGTRSCRTQEGLRPASRSVLPALEIAYPESWPGDRGRRARTCCSLKAPGRAECSGSPKIRVVHLPGRLTSRRGEVESAMQRAEIFAMPSRVEPFGIVMRSRLGVTGVPVIGVTSHGGAAEFIEDGVSGLIVDPFDEARLASVLTSLLDSPGVARQIGRSRSEANSRGSPGRGWQTATRPPIASL